MLIPASSFLGREAELVELGPLLTTSRVLTLTGPGGCGKTRLALEAVRRSGRDADAAVVALDRVGDPALVPATVLAAVGASGGAGGDPVARLAPALEGRALLVLDGCEHVLDAVRALVGHVLEIAPDIHVLATSRIRLGVAGEQVWPVPTMSRPSLLATPDDVEASDAGRLFLARAREHRPGFVLDAAGASAVASLCRRLDGLPLAIELAAGWVGTLSPGEIAPRMDQRFDLLVGGDSDQDRQRTLRATVEWSDALLTPEDRGTLARLAAFAGPFSLEQAATIDEAPAADVAHRIRRLIDASWLVATASGAGTVYDMLATLRAYAAELLERSADAAAVRERHARAFLTLAEASTEGLQGPDQRAWSERLERSSRDLEAAIAWAGRDTSGRHAPELGLRLATALWRWCATSGRAVQGLRWIDGFLTRRDVAIPLARQARARAVAAALASLSGDNDRAIELATRARRQCQAAGDHDAAAIASSVLGNVANHRGDVEAARHHLGEVVASRRSARDDAGLAVALHNLGTVLSDHGDRAGALRLFEEALVLKRTVGDRRSLGYTLANLADALLAEGRAEAARDALEEARGIAVDLGDDRQLGYVLANLGDVARALDPPDPAGRAAAASRYRDALELGRRVGDRHLVANVLCNLGRVTVAAGDRAGGLALLRESEAIAAGMGDEGRLADVRAALAEAGALVEAARLPDRLTPRQAEILGLVASGMSNREMASALDLSPTTVERHLANIYAKIGARGRVDAARYAVRHGLAARG